MCVTVFMCVTVLRHNWAGWALNDSVAGPFGEVPRNSALERADVAGVGFERVVLDLAPRGPGPCSAIPSPKGRGLNL